jgi:hypothetical protein
MKNDRKLEGLPAEPFTEGRAYLRQEVANRHT